MSHARKDELFAKLAEENAKLKERIAELEGARANECQTNVLDNITPEQRERLRHLEGTPDETRLCYLYRGMVRVMGTPKEGDDHSCDEMGCGSVGDHVVMRFVAPSRPYEVSEMRRELARFAEVNRQHMDVIAAQAAELDRLRKDLAFVADAAKEGGLAVLQAAGLDNPGPVQEAPDTQGELERLRAEHQELSDQFIANAQRLGSVCDNWHNWAVEIVGKEATRNMSGQDMRDEILRRLKDLARVPTTTAQEYPLDSGEEAPR